jgi:hypothetical protein
MTGVVRRSGLQLSAAATTLTPHIQLAAETKTGFPLRSIFQLVFCFLSNLHFVYDLWFMCFGRSRKYRDKIYVQIRSVNTVSVICLFIDNLLKHQISMWIRMNFSVCICKRTQCTENSLCGKTKVFRRNGTNYRNQSDMEGSYQGAPKCVSWPISRIKRTQCSANSLCGKTKVFRRNGTNYRNQSDMEGSYQGVQKCVS